MKTLVESLKSSLNEKEEINPLTIEFCNKIGEQVCAKFKKILSNKDVKNLFKECDTDFGESDSAEFSSLSIYLTKTDKNLFTEEPYDILEFRHFAEATNAYKQYVNDYEKFNKTIGNKKYRKAGINIFNTNSMRDVEFVFYWFPDTYLQSISDNYLNDEIVDIISTMMVNFIENLCVEFRDTLKKIK